MSTTVQGDFPLPLVALSGGTGRTAVNPWDGKVAGGYADGDPSRILDLIETCSVGGPTPTNISTTLARIAYFRLSAALTFNKIRFFGTGNTTNVYRVAVYNGDTLARLMAETAFTTVTGAWGAAGSGLNVPLTAGQLYFIAVSVNATGATQGIAGFGTTTSQQNGMINVLPKSWPGNLDIDLAFIPPSNAFGLFTTTAGALPDPAPTINVLVPLNQGFPAFFVDNDNT